MAMAGGNGVAMQLNWRGKAARAQFYFTEGSVALQQIKQSLYAAAALKIIFELSVITTVMITPVVILTMFLWGIFWVRHGWYKHLMEIPSIDAVAPISMWNLHMTVRLYQYFGLKLDDMDLRTMPPELQTVLASTRKD